MDRLKHVIIAQLFIIYTRYLIGGAFVFASVIKIKGVRFTSESGELNPIDSAWHFFETLYQSGLYWHFIGMAQLIAGALLMTQRYAKLGAAVYFPIMLNIFIITLSYYFAYTPIITGLMLLANVILLAWSWDELKVLFNLTPAIDNSYRMEKDSTWQWIGLVLFLFTLIYRLLFDKYNLIFWFGTCLLIGLVGCSVGVYRELSRRNLLRT